MNSPGISFTNAAEAASMRADLRGMIRAGAVAVSCVVSTATAAAETAGGTIAETLISDTLSGYLTDETRAGADPYDTAEERSRILYLDASDLTSGHSPSTASTVSISGVVYQVTEAALDPLGASWALSLRVGA